MRVERGRSDLAQHRLERIGDRPHRGELAAERLQLGGARLVADEQDVSDLLERRPLGEVGDLVSPVDQRRLVDGADLGVADGLSREAAGVFLDGGVSKPAMKIPWRLP